MLAKLVCYIASSRRQRCCSWTSVHESHYCSIVNDTHLIDSELKQWCVLPHFFIYPPASGVLKMSGESLLSLSGIAYASQKAKACSFHNVMSLTSLLKSCRLKILYWRKTGMWSSLTEYQRETTRNWKNLYLFCWFHESSCWPSWWKSKSGKPLHMTVNLL